jgi:hypothetical protein
VALRIGPWTVDESRAREALASGFKQWMVNEESGDEGVLDSVLVAAGSRSACEQRLDFERKLTPAGAPNWLGLVHHEFREDGNLGLIYRPPFSSLTTEIESSSGESPARVAAVARGILNGLRQLRGQSHGPLLPHCVTFLPRKDDPNTADFGQVRLRFDYAGFGNTVKMTDPQALGWLLFGLARGESRWATGGGSALPAEGRVLKQRYKGKEQDWHKLIQELVQGDWDKKSLDDLLGEVNRVQPPEPWWGWVRAVVGAVALALALALAWWVILPFLRRGEANGGAKVPTPEAPTNGSSSVAVASAPAWWSIGLAEFLADNAAAAQALRNQLPKAEETSRVVRAIREWWEQTDWAQLPAEVFVYRSDLSVAASAGRSSSNLPWDNALEAVLREEQARRVNARSNLLSIGQVHRDLRAQVRSGALPGWKRHCEEGLLSILTNEYTRALDARVHTNRPSTVPDWRRQFEDAAREVTNLIARLPDIPADLEDGELSGLNESVRDRGSGGFETWLTNRNADRLQPVGLAEYRPELRTWFEQTTNSWERFKTNATVYLDLRSEIDKLEKSKPIFPTRTAHKKDASTLMNDASALTTALTRFDSNRIALVGKLPLAQILSHFALTNAVAALRRDYDDLQSFTQALAQVTAAVGKRRSEPGFAELAGLVDRLPAQVQAWWRFETTRDYRTMSEGARSGWTNDVGFLVASTTKAKEAAEWTERIEELGRERKWDEMITNDPPAALTRRFPTLQDWFRKRADDARREIANRLQTRDERRKTEEEALRVAESYDGSFRIFAERLNSLAVEDPTLKSRLDDLKREAKEAEFLVSETNLAAIVSRAWPPGIPAFASLARRAREAAEWRRATETRMRDSLWKEILQTENAFASELLDAFPKLGDWATRVYGEARSALTGGVPVVDDATRSKVANIYTHYSSPRPNARRNIVQEIAFFEAILARPPAESLEYLPSGVSFQQFEDCLDAMKRLR